MKRWVKIAVVVICGGIGVLAATRGARVPFAQQWPLYEALRNTAAIVFAVVGAWLAIVYPERLKFGLGSHREGEKVAGGAGKVGRLLIPVVHSTVILAVVLLVGLLAPLVREFPIVREHVEIFRACSYVLLAALTLLQVWTVILTLLPASDLQTNVAEEEALRTTSRALFSHVRKGPKSPQS